MNKRLKNDSGMILVTVLMIVLVMSMFTLGIVSRSTSQSVSGESEIDRIKAEQLAKGAFWMNYSRLNAGLTVTNVPQAMDGKTYTITVTAGAAGSGPNNTTPYTLTSPY